MVDKIDELRIAVNRLAGEAAELRAEVARKTRSLWVGLVGLFLVTMAVLGSAYVVTIENSKAIESNNRKLCPMVTVLIPRPGEPLPSTVRGRLVVERAEKVAHDLGC